MKVQRGLITLSGGDLSDEVVLDETVPVGKSFVVSSLRLEPYFWVSPQTHADLEEAWEDEVLAYDGDVDTYAFTGSNEYLEFPFEGLVSIDKIRVRVKFVLADLTLGVSDVNIDVMEGEVWESVYNGEIDNDVWEEIVVQKNIQSIRIKFNNTFNSGDYGFLAELQLYEIPIDTWSGAMCRVELDSVSGDNYTKLKATRYSDNHTVKIEWQVIYGDEFNVQTGITDCNDLSTEVLQVINEVDCTKTFITHTNYTNSFQVNKSFMMPAFVTEEEILFSRGYGEVDDINSIRWYVVEWDSATVKEYSANLESSSVVIEIDNVAPTKAFLVSSYLDTGEENLSSFVRGDIVSSGEVSFTRREGNVQAINFFVVEHPDLVVQHNIIPVSGLYNTDIIDLVNINNCFTCVPQLGNALYVREEEEIEISFLGYNTHKLWQDGEDSVITVERGSDYGGEIEASYFVVGYETYVPILITNECTGVTYFSVKANGNITDSGGFDVYRRGFCYIRGTSGEPTIDDFVVYEDGEFDVGEYSLDIVGLNPSRTYRVRAYAVTALGVGYGGVVTFTIASAPMSEFCGTDVQGIGFVNKFKAPDY